MRSELFRTNQREKTSAILFAKIPIDADLNTIRKEVEHLLHGNWIDHVNRDHYCGGWDILPLRCQRHHMSAHPILQGFSIATGNEWENLPALTLSPALLSLITSLDCTVRSARLMRLQAGAEIKPHRDNCLGMEFGEARLHLPVHTTSAVTFLVDNKIIPMRAGELWYFNADQIHEVYNRGNEDRINLVIDCVVNEWLRAQILAGAHE